MGSGLGSPRWRAKRPRSIHRVCHCPHRPSQHTRRRRERLRRLPYAPNENPSARDLELRTADEALLATPTAAAGSTLTLTSRLAPGSAAEHFWIEPRVAKSPAPRPPRTNLVASRCGWCFAMIAEEARFWSGRSTCDEQLFLALSSSSARRATIASVDEVSRRGPAADTKTECAANPRARL
jgi:hypothetical protein